jgi:hypothetical protein
MDELRGRLEEALAGTYTFQRELGGGVARQNPSLARRALRGAG